ncbi:CIS tube protein [Serratia marcescens]|uniref:CIS tube protein n=1 Tax=Serratia marcescens TaxID=615 RepID=UPI003FA72A63
MMMGLRERGLAKLMLAPYPGTSTDEKFIAMYNPESIHLDYVATATTPLAGLNQDFTQSPYSEIEPPTLSLELILDARGPKSGGAVNDQVKKLRHLCFAMGPMDTFPRVQVLWGEMRWHGYDHFRGYVQNLAIIYTLFDRSGKPLRATVTLTLKALVSDAMASLKATQKPMKQVLQLPDKTSLPQLLAVAPVAAGATGYLATAYANDMDNLSGLMPGQMLISR